MTPGRIPQGIALGVLILCGFISLGVITYDIRRDDLFRFETRSGEKSPKGIRKKVATILGQWTCVDLQKHDLSPRDATWEKRWKDWEDNWVKWKKERKSVGSAKGEPVWVRKALPAKGVNLKGKNLRFAHLEDAFLAGADLEKADLHYSVLSSADLRVAKLWSAQLQGGILVSAKLQGADLWNAHLEQSDLEYADLRWARLVGADLTGAKLNYADLRWAKFSEDNHGKDESGVTTPQGANLTKARLRGAKLQDARLQDANLQGADLSEADLQGARLSRTNIQGANLKTAVNLTPEQAQEACCDQDTELPPHFDKTVKKKCMENARPKDGKRFTRK